MKSKIVLLSLCACLATLPAIGGERGPLAVVVDAAVVRPASLAVTVLGAGLFVATLPFSAISKSTGSTARALVGYPARMTFERPLGDLDALAGSTLQTGTVETKTAVDASKFSDLPEEKAEAAARP